MTPSSLRSSNSPPLLQLRRAASFLIASAAAAVLCSAALFSTLRRGTTAPPISGGAMAAPPRSFILWLHGLGDSGPANEPIRALFTSPEFRRATWHFPSAPNKPVTCNNGIVMPSWFDIHELPLTADSPKDERGVLEAVQNVHEMIDKKVAGGINPENIFVCGFSQGGALTLASVLLYPKTLGGGAIFSGWVPFNLSIIERITPEARKLQMSKHKEQVVSFMRDVYLQTRWEETHLTLPSGTYSHSFPEVHPY